MADKTDEQILKETNDASIKSQAEEIASTKIQELQSNIAKAVGGESDQKYGSIGDMQEDMDRRAEEKAGKAKEEAKTEIREELEAKEQKVKAQQEEKAKQTVDDQKKEWANMTGEWKEAVADGVAPSIEEKLAKKLESGTQYKDLTDEEKTDPGLVFYNKSRQKHAELKREGKSTSFYRTMTQMDRKPSSSSAPVFGGGIATPQTQEEYTDTDLNEATNRALGMGLPT